MAKTERVKVVLIVLVGLVISLALALSYYMLLELQLRGYRHRQSDLLEMIQLRDQRRHEIPGIPAVRERLLQDEFGDLPEYLDVRAEVELVWVWEMMLVVSFFFVVWGSVLYITLGKRRPIGTRLLRGLAVTVAYSQALPLMLLPENSLRFIRLIGVPLILAATVVLLVGALGDRITAMRENGAS